MGTTVEANTSERAGGGLWNAGALVLTDSTVTANAAKRPGGGILNRGPGVVTLEGTSSVTGNDPDDCVGTTAC